MPPEFPCLGLSFDLSLAPSLHSSAVRNATSWFGIQPKGPRTSIGQGFVLTPKNHPTLVTASLERSWKEPHSLMGQTRLQALVVSVFLFFTVKKSNTHTEKQVGTSRSYLRGHISWHPMTTCSPPRLLFVVRPLLPHLPRLMAEMQNRPSSPAGESFFFHVQWSFRNKKTKKSSTVGMDWECFKIRNTLGSASLWQQIADLKNILEVCNFPIVDVETNPVLPFFSYSLMQWTSNWTNMCMFP